MDIPKYFDDVYLKTVSLLTDTLPTKHQYHTLRRVLVFFRFFWTSNY